MIENLIGHEKTKKLLSIAITSARERNRNIPHTLFSGVAGCGKTTMAMELAKAAEVDFLAVSPDDFTDREAALKILDKLNHDNYDECGNCIGKIKPSVIFIDEIHRAPRKGQEVLGIAMEKFMLETGKPNKYFWIPYFTIIGATTDDGELTKPFREKFKLRFLFETYSFKEIVEIIRMHAFQMSIPITDKAKRAIARRSRGVPRTAKGFLESSRDYATSKEAEIVTSKIVENAFSDMGIDSKGLTSPEIRLLKTLYSSREPIGLENLAIITNESPKNLKNTIEPFLIREGLIIRSGKGRLITSHGCKHVEDNGYAGKARNKVEIAPDYVRK